MEPLDASAPVRSTRGEPLTLGTESIRWGHFGMSINGRIPGKGTRAEVGAKNHGGNRTPSKLTSGRFPLNLDAIVLKSLARTGERFAYAGEMSADIRRFLRRRPVLADPSPHVPTLRFCERNISIDGQSQRL